MKKNFNFQQGTNLNTTMQPNGFAKFKRKNIIWQIFRFFVIGFKILKVLAKGH